MSVQLKTGDPAEGPATFTRFVLPFRYSPGPWEDGGAAKHTFRRATPDNLEARRKYFTPATAGVLFDRAEWYALYEGHTIQANVPVTLGVGTCDGTPVAVQGRLHRPLIALFEAAPAFANSQKHERMLHTGFLILDLSFCGKLLLEELLLVNEAFRYWRRPFAGHDTQQRNYSRDGKPFVSTYASLIQGLPPPFGRDQVDPYLDRWATLLADIPLFRAAEASAYRIVPSDWDTKAKAWTNNGAGDGGWIASTDERAFVWTCAMTEGGSGALAKPASGTISGDWVRLLNVDTPSSAQATPFEASWAEKRTYTRWAHYGTLYGFAYHAGAMIAPPIDEPPIWRHFREIYFDQVLLLLYIRATTFRLSSELSCINDEENRDRQKSAEDFRKLRDTFAQFTNLYQFPLLSSQQQGLEMYVMARKAIDVEELYCEVKEQIESTHEYLELVDSAGRDGQIARLTTLGTFFVIMTLAVALLAAPPFTEIAIPWIAQWIPNHPRLVLTISCLSGGLLSVGVVLRLMRRPR